MIDGHEWAGGQAPGLDHSPSAAEAMRYLSTRSDQSNQIWSVRRGYWGNVTHAADEGGNVIGPQPTAGFEGADTGFICTTSKQLRWFLRPGSGFAYPRMQRNIFHGFRPGRDEGDAKAAFPVQNARPRWNEQARRNMQSGKRY